MPIITPIHILFFGSTTDSVIVLEKLFLESNAHNKLSIVAIVTQPPRPFGRNKKVTPTPVEIWGKTHSITVLSFESNKEKPWLYENEQLVIDTLQSIKPDLLISASYGQKIPWETISKAPRGGINVHPSILPRWRGADPVPWAILTGDHQVGVTIVKLSEHFDEGEIVAQQKIPLLPTDTSGPLRTKLFRLGAELLLRTFDISSHVRKDIKINTTEKSTYARKLKREDGFEPWDAIQRAIDEGVDAERIERKFRAFSPWPGIWTKFNLQTRLQARQVNKSTNDTWEEKRLKIVTLHKEHEKLIIDSVQLEGKNPVSWQQFKQAYTKEILSTSP